MYSSIKNWSEFCDLYAHAQPIFLLCCKFQIIILKTVRDDAETWSLLCNVYKAIFVSKSRVCNSSNKIWSEFYDLYAHAQPIFLHCCQFQIIILTTVECAETQTLLCHMYKAIFVSKSRVCNSSNLFVLRFYGPVNPMGSCRARSVYLTTRLLGRLSPLSG